MPNRHPPVAHYNRGVIQPIDFMESNFTPDEYRGFLKGQIVKYIARYRYKGEPIDDLKKAKTYLEWLIEFEGKQPASPHWTDGIKDALRDFGNAVVRHYRALSNKEKNHDKRQKAHTDQGSVRRVNGSGGKRNAPTPTAR